MDTPCLPYPQAVSATTYISPCLTFLPLSPISFIYTSCLYMSCHLHVIKGHLFINVITTYISSYIKQISRHAQNLNINPIPQQKHPHSYFLIPLSADTHLMDPLLFPLSVFHRTSQMPASPLLCFRWSSFSSLFTQCLSLPFCDLVRKKQRESLQGQTILSFRQRGSQPWSVTADEAHRSSWLTGQWKS